jgi:hypothetical protein
MARNSDAYRDAAAAPLVARLLCKGSQRLQMLVSLLLSLSLLCTAQAQPTTALTTEQDHQRSLQLLGITALRQGANGSDPMAPNAANYDESKANPSPQLPDPLLTLAGAPVTTPQQWQQVRRPELLALFDREVYGRVPAAVPAVKWQVVTSRNLSIAGIPAIEKQLSGAADNTAWPALNVAINAILILPATSQGPVPVLLQFSGGRFLTSAMERAQQSDSWQAQALQRGWGHLYLDTGSVQLDNGGGLTAGIIGLTNQGQPRAMDDWGVLRAWAWGASRVLDYLQSDPAVDASRVAVAGHSRWGKGALVAMAYDTRFSLGYISSSGAGGAKLHRRYYGEQVENVAAASEYHWMAGNYLQYAGPLQASDLPVDAHELIALVAPRPLFISSGNDGDQWVDARGMFMAAAAAQPVYRLLGAHDMGADQFPPLETGLLDGEISFRQHSGGHTDQPNWPVFLAFAARYWH